MDALFILAQASGKSANVVPVDLIWEQVTSLSWIQALIAVSFGAVYLFYGWRVFKVITVVCFGMLGLFAGMRVGGMITSPNSVLWGGIIGLALLAVLSIPLMKWAVSILGAVAGGILTSGIWYACGLPQQFIWAGAIIGIVAGGMISFIVFKIAVMMFTSLGGAGLIIVGVLALLYRYEMHQTEKADFIRSLVFNYDWFLPAMLIFATFVGMVIQNKLVKGTSDWKL
ncbi:MAG: hypothetical protein NTW93_00590 [Phycisphaerae bacterium]|nr:hypothetical protein [Phycisphaerae bacterium]